MCIELISIMVFSVGMHGWTILVHMNGIPVHGEVPVDAQLVAGYRSTKNKP